MNSLLWTLVVIGGLNTASVVVKTILLGKVPPISQSARAADAIYTFGLCCWALYLLARQS